MTPEILIPTNGFKGTWQSIEYGAWLAKTLGSKITLLGVNENPSPGAIDETHHPLEEVFAYATGVFQLNGAEYRLEVQNGSADELIPQRANQADVIVVLGKLGRPTIRHLLSGRSIRHFLEEIKQPILYVPELRLPLKRILICIGGLGYEVAAEDLAVQIAAKCQAEITLLNVVPPIDFDYPTARALQENWRHPEETDTPIGKSLRIALDVAQAAGLHTTVRGRQGNVVEEIFAESREGNYDLLCMGSSYSVHSLRQMYSPNVTAEIANGTNCPILTARYNGE
ncbi:MAG: universal stress protein [Anaerolineales bacterium]|nr:universal stress protein [Anaerolineales bacterium]